MKKTRRFSKKEQHQNNGLFELVLCKRNSLGEVKGKISFETNSPELLAQWYYNNKFVDPKEAKKSKNKRRKENVKKRKVGTKNKGVSESTS